MWLARLVLNQDGSRYLNRINYHDIHMIKMGMHVLSQLHATTHLFRSWRSPRMPVRDVEPVSDSQLALAWCTTPGGWAMHVALPGLSLGITHFCMRYSQDLLHVFDLCCGTWGRGEITYLEGDYYHIK